MLAKPKSLPPTHAHMVTECRVCLVQVVSRQAASPPASHVVVGRSASPAPAPAQGSGACLGSNKPTKGTGSVSGRGGKGGGRRHGEQMDDEVSLHVTAAI